MAARLRAWFGRCYGNKTARRFDFNAVCSYEPRDTSALCLSTLAGTSSGHVGFAAPAAGSRRQPCGGAATATSIAGATATSIAIGYVTAIGYERIAVQPELVHEP